MPFRPISAATAVLAIVALAGCAAGGGPSSAGAATSTTAPPTTTTVPAVGLGEATDLQFHTCVEAVASGFGPYVVGDLEYDWYPDDDGDGVVCD